MKKTLIALACTIACALPAYSQANNVGYKVSGTTVTVIKATTTASPGPDPTGMTYVDRDSVRYPVYQNKKGTYYVLKTSKNTGSQYRYYLPKKLQVAFAEIHKNLKR